MKYCQYGRFLSVDPKPEKHAATSPETLEALALAILLEHLGDAEQAREVCGGFARLMAARLGADFWTLRENEIAAAIASVTGGTDASRFRPAYR